MNHPIPLTSQGIRYHVARKRRIEAKRVMGATGSARVSVELPLAITPGLPLNQGLTISSSQNTGGASATLVLNCSQQCHPPVTISMLRNH